MGVVLELIATHNLFVMSGVTTGGVLRAPPGGMGPVTYLGSTDNMIWSPLLGSTELLAGTKVTPVQYPMFTADHFHLAADLLPRAPNVPSGLLLDIDGDPRQPQPNYGCHQF